MANHFIAKLREGMGLNLNRSFLRPMPTSSIQTRPVPTRPAPARPVWDRRVFAGFTFCLAIWIVVVVAVPASGQKSRQASEDEKAVELAAKSLGGFLSFPESSFGKDHILIEPEMMLFGQSASFFDRWNAEFSSILMRMVDSDSMRKRYRVSKDQIAELKFLTRNWAGEPKFRVNMFVPGEASESSDSGLPPDLDIPFHCAPFRNASLPAKPTEQDHQCFLKILESDSFNLIKRDCFQVVSKVDYSQYVRASLPPMKILYPMFVLDKWGFAEMVQVRKEQLKENKEENQKAYLRILKQLPPVARRKMVKLTGSTKGPALKSLLLTRDNYRLSRMGFQDAAPILIFNGLFVDQDYTYGLELTEKQIEQFLPELKRLRGMWKEVASEKLKETWSKFWKEDQGQGSGDPEEKEKAASLAVSRRLVDFNKEISQFADRFRETLTRGQLRRLKQMNQRSFCALKNQNPVFWPLLLERELGLTNLQRRDYVKEVDKEVQKLADRYKKIDEKYFQKVVKSLPKESQEKVKEFLEPIENTRIKKR